jgi:hypothetical protein
MQGMVGRTVGGEGMTALDPLLDECGPSCKSCGMTCKRGLQIDSEYASRLAFMLECVVLDPHGHFEAACTLLDQYKAAWEKVNPSPPTFMGEPMPADRRERLANLVANRAETSGSPCTGGPDTDVRADVRADVRGVAK